jgi:DNA helicase-2/ATP-dependent DNA helicase PcrA
MSGSPPFEPPAITDEEIRWASRLLGLGEDGFHGESGEDPRQEVLKSIDQVDVSACPGSGKTTLLVAKLAILAEKWLHRTRGICVLSHTNAARHEIEIRLGKTTAGQRLLAYPHFIGTIHGFVNEFLALPWLRSRGYPIRMISTELCHRRRWNALPRAIRSVLEKNRHGPFVLTISSPDCGVGELRWGKRGVLSMDTPTYQGIRDVCQQSTKEGYFCYDEMFVWAGELMDKVPGAADVLRDRFPVLFVDEAQDNSENQSAILHRIFSDTRGLVIRQRFGDGNQAIYSFVGGEGATTDAFPDDAVKRDLPNSYRFGPNIAKLADPLGWEPYPNGLIGQGPGRTLESGRFEGPHTIFLFSDDQANKVLNAYAQLLVETFSDRELRDGTFTAVGMVHRAPEQEEEHKFPHHVGHYWSQYDADLTHRDPKPQTFVQYLHAGQREADAVNEAWPAVEKIAEGFLRLARMADKGMTWGRRYSHRYVLQRLEKSAKQLAWYNIFVSWFILRRKDLTDDVWKRRWRGVVKEIAGAIASAPLTEDAETARFLEWKQESNQCELSRTDRESSNNVFCFPPDDPVVRIRIGSIHSIKGETHTATLVLETFWQGRNGQHNLELLLPWLKGCKPRAAPRVQQQVRLKLHYVALTRPTHLLCLAMRESAFDNHGGGEVLRELEDYGWQVTRVNRDAT